MIGVTLMRCMCLLLGLVLFLTSFKAYGEGDQRIAVLELSNPAGLEKQEVLYLSDLLRRLTSSELAQTFLVIDKANILELLPPDKTLEECIGECAVETGRLLQASYIITGDIIKFGKALRVTVRLHDTKTGRLIASEVASGREVTDMESGIQEAGGRLLRKLIRGAREPSATGTREKIGGSTQKVGALTQRLIATLQSRPQGAAIVVDGVQVCSEGTLTCEVELNEGAHQVSMTKTDYFVRSGTVTFINDSKGVTWSLDPNFATLKVTTTPSNLNFTINGEEHQGSYTQRITPQKSYRVVSSDRCFEVSGENVSAGKPGEEITVNLAPAELFGVLDVSARDQAGNPLEATVIVDEEEFGMTPRQYRIPLCSKTLEVKKGLRKFNQALSLSQGSTLRVVATLNLDPDCDLNSYVDNKIGGYFVPTTLFFLSVSGIVLGQTEISGVGELNALLFIGGIVTLANAGGFLLKRHTERQKAFSNYKPPAKCQAGLQSSRVHNPPRPVSPSIKLAPILAPSTDGVTFGLSGIF